MNWYQSLPPAEAQVPCGTGTHAVRWEAGQLALAAHPDAEAELVLAALGGDKPFCVEVAEAWDRHADDLDVLMAGPRSRSDKVASGWDDVREHLSVLLGLPPGSVSARATGTALRRGPIGSRISEGLARFQSHTEMLQLLALGPAFQFRLAGTVAMAWSAGREDHAGWRPELVAALAGRLAPAVAEWLGIDPDSVAAAPLDGAAPTAWGTLETFGSGAGRRVRASLPFGWLASVWACGLAVVDGHLVVAIEQPGWPHARVLALREPGATPVQLAVVATDDAPLPHWAISA